MKRNIIIFIFLILVATSFKLRSKTPSGILNSDSRVLIEQVSDTPSENKIPVRNLEEEVRNLESLENEALSKSDTATLYDIWSPDLVVNTAENKILTFADFKNGFERNQTKPFSYEKVIEKITISENVAVVMGYEKAETGKKSAKPSESRFTDMWIKDGTGWKLTARQCTSLAVAR
ncbi:protein of unknown function [Dyadobacter koreensis]|uniref:DUF4440 domain-containing protein n=1 Tax=Dyadobacter koreensis TaxID=408657 RepID=A0A1H6REE8_9BACT|nr:nuclear transport factor 2 family protein [Dyadobacter koreensis]SEI54133.1 protein of unknown function [Dyadobacter koreensis]